MKTNRLVLTTLLLLGFIFSAHGQVKVGEIATEPTAFADLKSPGYYAIKCYVGGKTGYLKYTGAETSPWVIDTNVSFENGVYNTNYLFTFTKSGRKNNIYFTIAVYGNIPIGMTDDDDNFPNPLTGGTALIFQVINSTSSDDVLMGSLPIYLFGYDDIYLNAEGDDLHLFGGMEDTPGPDSKAVAFAFYQELTATEAKKVQEDLNNLLSLEETGYVGDYTHTYRQNLNAAYSTYSSSKSDTDKEAFYTLYNSPERVTIETGKYYEIKNLSSINNLWLSSENTLSDTEGNMGGDLSLSVLRTTESGAETPKLWQFESAGDGQYYIRNANTANWLGKPRNSSDEAVKVEYALNATDAGTYTIEDGSKTVVDRLLKADGTSLISAYNGDATDATDNYPIVREDDNETSNTSNYWNIIPVTTIPLYIYTDTNWASACFPFGVTIPDGLVAYAATSATKTSLQLTEIGQSIPANTPVLIADKNRDGEVSGSGVNEKRTYILTIDNTASASIGANVLTGATVARTGFAKGEGETCSFYFLTSNGNNGGKFIMNGTHTSVGANKAYILSSDVTTSSSSDEPAANALELDWTGLSLIEDVTDNSAAAKKYYDLNGRRALYPAHGIYVTEEGEKVFIK